MISERDKMVLLVYNIGRSLGDADFVKNVNGVLIEKFNRAPCQIVPYFLTLKLPPHTSDVHFYFLKFKLLNIVNIEIN